MSIVANLDWVEEEKLSDGLLFFFRNVPTLSSRLKPFVQDPINRILLGFEEQQPVHTNSIETDIRIAKAWILGGNVLPVSFAAELEERAKINPVLHIDAARLHVLSCPTRELNARMALSTQNIPYIFPGEIAPLHIEIFAVGDRALHVLHVEWLKKLSAVAIDALEIDFEYKKAWSLPFLEVLPERELKNRIRKLARKKKFRGGGLGLLAFYGSRIGLDAKQLLQQGDDYDQLFFLVAKESERRQVL